jgi:2-polyprenyl-6-methoxyphenol hydroxylase-like FAD-dependent oxidoreductase
VVAETAAGATRPLSARLTVGADGLGSAVARQVGAPVLREGRTASAVLYRYVHDLPVAGYEWMYGQEAAAGLIPTNDGATCVFVSTTPARMRTLRAHGAEEAFRALLDESRPGLAERVGHSTGWSPMHGWRAARGLVRRPYGPGWALVGDAGYYTDPITTHGITGALRDAELLADAALAALGGGPDAGRALAAYHGTRDRLSAQLFDATEEVAAYAWDARRARSVLRTVSASMSDEVEHLATLPERRVPVAVGATGPRSGAEPDNRAVPR